jgi:hypothetical protein
VSEGFPVLFFLREFLVLTLKLPYIEKYKKLMIGSSISENITHRTYGAETAKNSSLICTPKAAYLATPS